MRIERSSTSPSRGGAPLVAPTARTMLARLMMPTILSSRMTGTRLIRLASSNAATSARSVSSVTVATSRVMISLTVRPCDLTYSRARSEAKWSSHQERRRSRWRRAVPISVRCSKSPSLMIPTRRPPESRTGAPLIPRSASSVAKAWTVVSGSTVITSVVITSTARIMNLPLFN